MRTGVARPATVVVSGRTFHLRARRRTMWLLFDLLERALPAQRRARTAAEDAAWSRATRVIWDANGDLESLDHEGGTGDSELDADRGITLTLTGVSWLVGYGLPHRADRRRFPPEVNRFLMVMASVRPKPSSRWVSRSVYVGWQGDAPVESARGLAGDG
jgi:hypothetical protein